MTEPARAKCPVCGRNAVRQISGGAALIFKGSGFYITDYGKDGKGPRQDKDRDTKADATPAKVEETGSKPEAASKAEKSEQSEKGDGSARDKSNKSDKTEKTDSSARDKKSSKKKASS
jgi:predicted nucleic acid-binding Zn ribbon protein